MILRTNSGPLWDRGEPKGTPRCEKSQQGAVEDAKDKLSGVAFSSEEMATLSLPQAWESFLRLLRFWL